MVVLGKKEIETETLSVRGRDGAETRGLTPADFINRLKEENTNRR